MGNTGDDLVDPDDRLADILMGVDLKRINLTTEGQHLDIIDGVNLIVGPNNSGKSTLIRELGTAVRDQPGNTHSPFKVVGTIALSYRHAADDVASAVDACLGLTGSLLVQADPNMEPYIRARTGGRLSKSELVGIWSNPQGAGRAGDFFSIFLDADTRANPQLMSEAPALVGVELNNPLHWMWKDKEIERQLNDTFRSTFGEGLFVNRYGRQITLHLGEIESFLPTAPDDAYIRELTRREQVLEQGHGMRAFCQIVLSVMAGRYSLIAIDEPELFLHPPQARRLAEVLMGSRQPGTRIVIATHSSDIIQGFVSACEGKNLSITRITRREKANHLAKVNPKRVLPLYTDPLLRRSSVLDGLFYHGVVVCEAEGDATYYSTVDDFAFEGKPEAARPDLHLTYAHGNGRISNIVQTMRAAGVPVATIVDIDTAVQKDKINDLIEAHGGTSGAVDADVAILESHVRPKQADKHVNRDDARRVLNQILNNPKNGPFLTEDELERATFALKGTGVYKQFKEGGSATLRGESVGAFQRIADYLASLGIFVLEVGELESFHPEVAGRKADRLATVLTEGLYKDPQGKQHAFVGRVRQYILAKQ